MSARDEVLARVRAARGDTADAASAPGEPPFGDYRRCAPLAAAPLAALFAERCRHYGARVVACPPSGVASAVAAALAARDARRVVRPAGLPAEWCPDGIAWTAGDPGDPRSLDAVDAVLTGCAVAIAQTGTVVLDGGPGQGARALTLLPDHHVCVVAAERLVHLVPEAVARLAEAAHAGRPLTFVSGSSATSDIELERVAGVHGPRRLDVVLVTSPR